MTEYNQNQSAWQNSDKTQRIFRRIGLDWVSGVCAAFTAAPVIMMIDKAVVQKSGGSATISASIKESMLSLMKNPIRFILKKEFLWIMFVYGSTYMAANSIDSLCKIYHKSDLFPKLIGVTAVNMTASILKDRAFAYSYGNKVMNKVGLVSMMLWLVRDVLTVAGAFVLPSRLAYLFQKTGMDQKTSQKVTQMTLPVTFQIALTPIHLLGYDHYNFATRKFGERLTYIRGVYPSTLAIRMVRMGTAYGIGANNNSTFRHALISRFEGEDWNKSY